MREPISSGARNYVNRWICIQVCDAGELCRGSQPVSNKAQVACSISITGP